HGGGGHGGGGHGGHDGGHDKRCDEKGIEVKTIVKYKEKLTCEAKYGGGRGYKGKSPDVVIKDLEKVKEETRTDKKGEFEEKVKLEQSLECPEYTEKVDREFIVKSVDLIAKQKGDVIATAHCEPDHDSYGEFKCEIDNNPDKHY
ncbi:MAG TPA: hypothetical protein VK034_11635, partial [Enhygromyxa sp.]|nr:hypothetical protein [Enhygromyxa sp.]